MDTKPCLDCQAKIVVFESDTERKDAYCPPCGFNRLKQAEAIQCEKPWLAWKDCLEQAFYFVGERP